MLEEVKKLRKELHSKTARDKDDSGEWTKAGGRNAKQSEEAASANVLLHIVDSSAEDRTVTIDRVNYVLKEIDAHSLPTLMVYN